MKTINEYVHYYLILVEIRATTPSLLASMLDLAFRSLTVGPTLQIGQAPWLTRVSLSSNEVSDEISEKEVRRPR